MARLNPKRRLLAKIRVYDDMAHRATVAANTEPQQQGAVRSSCDKYTGFAHLSAPRERGSAPAWYRAPDGKMTDQRERGVLPPFKARKNDYTK